MFFIIKVERYILVAAETGPFGRMLNLFLDSPVRPADATYVSSNFVVAALDPYLKR